MERSQNRKKEGGRSLQGSGCCAQDVSDKFKYNTRKDNSDNRQIE